MNPIYNSGDYILTSDKIIYRIVNIHYGDGYWGHENIIYYDIASLIPIEGMFGTSIQRINGLNTKEIKELGRHISDGPEVETMLKILYN